MNKQIKLPLTEISTARLFAIMHKQDLLNYAAQIVIYYCVVLIIQFPVHFVLSLFMDNTMVIQHPFIFAAGLTTGWALVRSFTEWEIPQKYKESKRLDDENQKLEDEKWSQEDFNPIAELLGEYHKSK